jgi:hypothetical protein
MRNVVKNLGTGFVVLAFILALPLVLAGMIMLIVNHPNASVPVLVVSFAYVIGKEIREIRGTS